jgi:hypothetical protein
LKERDIYADLEKIEERGKRKKDRKGLSLFGKKDESDTPEQAPKRMEQLTPSLQKAAEKPIAGQYQEPTEVKRQEGNLAVSNAKNAEPKQRIESTPPPKQGKSTTYSVYAEESPKTRAHARSPGKNQALPANEKVTNDKLEPLEPLEGPEDYKSRDIYADLQKIEERGSKKKQPAHVSKSFWGKKESEKKQEVKPASEPQQQVEFGACRACGASLTPGASSCDICGAKLMETPELKPAQSQSILSGSTQKVPKLAPARQAEPLGLHPDVERKEADKKIAPDITQPIDKERTKQNQVIERRLEETIKEEKPVESTPQEWKPLEGRARKKAEDALIEFKRKLDKGFRSGVLTKEECLAKVKDKETELGLRPPTA